MLQGSLSRVESDRVRKVLSALTMLSKPPLPRGTVLFVEGKRAPGEAQRGRGIARRCTNDQPTCISVISFVP